MQNWLIDQHSIEGVSTIASILFLLDLYKRKIIDAKYVVKNIRAEQLNDILHPIIDINSTKELKKSIGGIAGSAGATTGKVYFSASSLIEAQKKSKNGR